MGLVDKTGPRDSVSWVSNTSFLLSKIFIAFDKELNKEGIEFKKDLKAQKEQLLGQFNSFKMTILLWNINHLNLSPRKLLKDTLTKIQNQDFKPMLDSRTLITVLN